MPIDTGTMNEMLIEIVEGKSPAESALPMTPRLLELWKGLAAEVAETIAADQMVVVPSEHPNLATYEKGVTPRSVAEL